MRKLFVSAVVAFVAGCSSAGQDQPSVTKAIWERVMAMRDEVPKEPSAKATPTRAYINELNVAMVQMNLTGETIFPILLPTHRNGSYVTYGNKFRQTLTLRESQITATRGFGTDLVSASSSDDDPLKSLTHPDRWPQTVMREYRFGGGGPTGRIERYECKITRGGPATITLAGTPFEVIGFAETCQGQSGNFQNLYAADASTGRVWQSQQYVGGTMPAINLDILEPLTE